MNQLAADPIFAAVPNGAQMEGPIVKTPARWQDNGWFEHSGWSGPAAGITFVDYDPPDTVLAYYADLAMSSGWIGNGNQKDGFPVDWTKNFPGGWQGGLGLIDMSSRSARPGQPHTFVLNASAPAV